MVGLARWGVLTIRFSIFKYKQTCTIHKCYYALCAKLHNETLREKAIAQLVPICHPVAISNQEYEVMFFDYTIPQSVVCSCSSLKNTAENLIPFLKHAQNIILVNSIKPESIANLLAYFPLIFTVPCAFQHGAFIWGVSNKKGIKNAPHLHISYRQS